MTITLDLPTAVFAQLKAEADATGKNVETVIREAVDAKLSRRKESLGKAFEAIQDAIEASGMSPDEATALLDDELRAMRAERRSSRVNQ
jgi:uncharacterized protein YoaH (UPF0181 family)